MDPYSAEGELVHIHSALHQGQYDKVLEFDTSGFSPENETPAALLKYRAQIALGQYDDAIKAASGDSTPDAAAAKALAQYCKGDTDGGLEAAKKLAADEPDNLGVQLLAGTVLANAGLTEEALALLAKHQGSLDAVALIVQIHLAQNRTDLAAKEALGARKWAQDSLLVNIAESWIGVRQGGEKYQQSFYVFEELAQAPATTAVRSLVGQAVSELHLGRLPETEAALKQAVDMDNKNADVLANSIVLNTINGKENTDLMKQLEAIDAQHQLLVDLAAKKELFEAAAGKYTPKFEP